jgi:hypothetical protein
MCPGGRGTKLRRSASPDWLAQPVCTSASRLLWLCSTPFGAALLPEV